MFAKYLSLMWAAFAPARQSFMAIDTLCYSGRIVDVGCAKESHPDSLLALAGAVGEISELAQV
jgi:hypothetical protein